jgi:hypothetical protein
VTLTEADKFLLETNMIIMDADKIMIETNVTLMEVDYYRLILS